MERHIKKVLVGIDGSESSKKALEMAIVITKAAAAGLTILEVIEEFGPLPGYYGSIPAGVDRAKWISEQRFETIHPMLDEENVNWDRIVVEGYPADEICKIAGNGNFDLVVIGSKGRSSMDRFLLGSVSDKVVHHSPCSVMIVK